MWNQETLILIVTLCLYMVQALLQDLTCFSSADPAAQGLTKVFDLLNDEDNLWEKRSRPVCSVTIPTSFSHCCPDIQGSISSQVVYLFCHNLTGAELLMMEGSEGPVPFNKTDCPAPPTPAEDQTGHLGPAAITSIVLAPLIGLAAIIIIIIVYKGRRSSSNQNQESERGPGEAENGTPLLPTINEIKTANGH